MRLKAHIGWIFFGVSEFYSPDTNDQSLKNYGVGVNMKLFMDFESEKLGSFSLRIFRYHIWTYPGTVQRTSGNVGWWFIDIQYSYPMTKYLSSGIAGSFAFEYGRFSETPDTRKWSNTIKMFVSWAL
jgi:hypothetical protein